jgi:hypothetical protein
MAFTEIDRHALEWHGSTSTDASTSAIVLGLLELGVFAPAAWLCALLLLGSTGIGNSETVPWLIGVPLGLVAVTAIVITAHTHPSPHPTRTAQARATLATAVASTLSLMRHPGRGLLTAAAIAVYWAADIAALWAALQFVSTPISLPRLILGYATGYLLTRRTLPFAGAIIVEAMMAVSLVWVGVHSPPPWSRCSSTGSLTSRSRSEARSSPARRWNEPYCLARWPRDEQLKVRMGVHTGEPRVRDGDYTGTDRQ